MNELLQELLRELEQFGSNNDSTVADRPRRMLNITRDTGEFLSVLVRAMNARRVLEIGTSNGYSTLWLAVAARAIDGHVTTVELSAFKRVLAEQNFARSGLAPFIALVHGDAGALLRGTPDSAFDLIFLDSERSQYPGWWPDVRRVLRQGGLLVVDNATSHAAELAPFVALVAADPDFTTCTAPVGNGEFLATRGARSRGAQAFVGADRREAALPGILASPESRATQASGLQVTGLEIERLDHLVLTVKDVEITASFYSRVLGMGITTFAAGRKALAFGMQKINLHQHGSEFEPKAQRPTPGSADLCFMTSVPIPEVVSHLSSCGIAVIEGPVRRTGATGPILSVYFRDPDMNLIEVANRVRA